MFAANSPTNSLFIPLTTISVLLTDSTVKPSGTVAKLAGVSEGMHFHYAGYLIQRIRFQDTDPLLDALKECGYRMEPDIYTDHTICVEFPVKATNAENKNFEEQFYDFFK